MSLIPQILALILTIFWLGVIYYIVDHEKERRRRHEEEDEKHWPLHHA